MMKTEQFFASSLLGLLVACGSQTKTGVTKAPAAPSFEHDRYGEEEEHGDEELPYDPYTEPQPTSGTAKLDNLWWQSPEACPSGSTLHGGIPPEHTIVGCKTENGKNVGRSTEFFKSSQKKEEGQFENHFAEGVWTAWDEKGQRASESHYSRGKKEGIETVWYPDGKIKSQRSFQGGRRDGVTYIWDDRVRLRTALTYRKGLKHGPEVFWTIRGSLHEVVHWKNGEKE